jgi:signal transduction histidine kinase
VREPNKKEKGMAKLVWPSYQRRHFKQTTPRPQWRAEKEPSEQRPAAKNLCILEVRCELCVCGHLPVRLAAHSKAGLMLSFGRAIVFLSTGGLNLIKQMWPARWFPILLGALCVMPAASWAQKASNWRAFKAADGLAESFTTSVTVSPRGNVWVRHFDVDTINWLDGYEVKSIPSPGVGNYRVYEGRAGQLWAVYPEGLQEYRDGTWIRYPIKEIRAEYQTNALRQTWPISLAPMKQGHVLFLLTDRLMEFDNEVQPQTTVIRHVNQTRLGRFLDLIAAQEGGVWISGMKGLGRLPGMGRVLNPETEWQEFILEAQLQVEDLKSPVEDDQGGITTVAESLATHNKALVYFDGRQWTVREARGEKIRHAWRDTDNRFRFTTINSLFHFEADGSQIIEDEEISAGSYFDVATEPNGIFWLATSEGLFRYAPLAWRTPSAVSHLNSFVHSIREDRAGRLWFVSATSLNALKDDHWKSHRFPDNLEINFQATDALFSLPDGIIVMEGGGRLLQFDPQTESFSFVSRPLAARTKLIGQLNNGTVCVQIFPNQGNSNSHRLEIYDGKNFQPFPDLPMDLNLGSELYFLFTARNGELWLGGNGGVAHHQDNKWQTFAHTDGNAPDGARCVAEIEEGKIWCAGRNKIWEFNEKKWSIVQSGFDRVNGLLKSRDGSIWAADNKGLHRFYKGEWTLNSVEEGLPGATISEIYEDRHGRIWAGTSRGLSLFHPEADVDPPRTFIQKVINEKNASAEPSVTLVFGGRDKWKFTPDERLLYSGRLDEQEWSPYQSETSVSFSELKAGRHIFKVRAMDRNANVDPKPALLEFAVALPWYQETRLVLISLAGLAFAIFFAVLAFNRHRQLARSYAEVEKIVALRTGQLEKANQELLQSQKMTALGTLAAGIAHDFNSILSIIKGSAQIIEDNLENRDKIQTRLDRIKSVVDQGAGIVKAMLGFSRTSDQKPARCNLNAIVEDTIKLLGDRFQREVQIQFEPTPALPEIPAVKDFMQQMLLNFIFNAADACMEPGRVILRTGQLNQLPVNLVLHPAEAANYIFIAVQDFGCGIAPEIMPRIFEPFFTTKGFSARRGTGLGLSMVYELARKTGCGLTVESAVGKGSTFTILIPVRNLPPDAPA